MIRFISCCRVCHCIECFIQKWNAEHALSGLGLGLQQRRRPSWRPSNSPLTKASGSSNAKAVNHEVWGTTSPEDKIVSWMGRGEFTGMLVQTDGKFLPHPIPKLTTPIWISSAGFGPVEHEAFASILMVYTLRYSSYTLDWDRPGQQESQPWNWHRFYGICHPTES